MQARHSKSAWLVTGLALLISSAASANYADSYYRNAGEWIASRTVRSGLPTEPSALLLTNGKRYDVTLGKRLDIVNWGETSLWESFSFGVDGGMNGSFTRLNQGGRLTFATETFDGFFGAYLARAWRGNIAMLRTAHHSAHLVDNSPSILRATQYSQFWTEIIFGRSFPHPDRASRWDLYVQGRLGVHHRSMPKGQGLRTALGVNGGYAFSDPDSLAALFSLDYERAGVVGHLNHYGAFVGLGFLSRTESKRRPFRAGFNWQWGADHRHQFFYKKSSFPSFQIQTEL